METDTDYPISSSWYFQIVFPSVLTNLKIMLSVALNTQEASLYNNILLKTSEQNGNVRTICFVL